MLLICSHMRSSWSSKESSVKPKGLEVFACLLIFNILFIALKWHNILLFLFMICIIKRTVPPLSSSELFLIWIVDCVQNWSELGVLERFSIQANMPSSYGSHLGSFLKVYQNSVKYIPFVLPAKTWKYGLPLWRRCFDNGQCYLGN